MNAIGPENGKGATAIAPLLNNYLTDAENTKSSPQDQAASYALIAPRLLAGGYMPLPIRPNDKAPIPTNWSQPDADTFACWQRDHPHAGTGLLTRNNPALDIDLPDAAAADAVEVLARGWLGDTPLRRVGQAPKRLLVYRASTQFSKRRVVLLAPDDPDDFDGRKVEVLADGQQYVGWGIHPGTGQPYTWTGESPLGVHAADLPEINEELVVAFLNAAADLLIREHGYRRKTPKKNDAVPPPPLPPGDLSKVADALRYLSSAEYDDWISNGHALKSGFGDAALPVWHWWSALSEKYDREETDEKWASFKPSSITPASIYYDARLAGWFDTTGFSETLAALIPKPPVPPRFQLLTSRQLDDQPAVPDLVRGILPSEGIAAIFGPSASGKSFLLLDLLAAVAKGRDWFGHKVRRAAPVTYVGLEGQAGVRKRKTALEVKFGALPDSFRFVLPQSLNIRAEHDRLALVQAIKATGGIGGIVCIDTLNAAAPGADENSSVDMSGMIEGAKAIQAALGGLVIIIHHSGKDVTRGLRGHSSLFAALDAVIAVERDPASARRIWKIAKSKDDADDAEHAFILCPRTVGADEDGSWQTSCFVDADNAPQSKPNRPMGKNLVVIFDRWTDLLTASGQHGQGGAPADMCCIELSDLLDRAAPLMTCRESDRRKRAETAINGLIEQGFIQIGGNWLWKP